jgi:hypothetical protein
MFILTWAYHVVVVILACYQNFNFIDINSTNFTDLVQFNFQQFSCSVFVHFMITNIVTISLLLKDFDFLTNVKSYWNKRAHLLLLFPALFPIFSKYIMTYFFPNQTLLVIASTRKFSIKNHIIFFVFLARIPKLSRSHVYQHYIHWQYDNHI